MEKVWEEIKEEGTCKIFQIPLSGDTFGYLLTINTSAIGIDPGEEDPFHDILEQNSIQLEAVFITHHHKEHYEGAEALREKTAAKILGPHHESLDFLNQDVAEGEECSIGPFTIQVLELPGHTLDHVGYYIPLFKALFCGDALLLSGVLPIPEGNEELFFESLQKIKALPNDTLIFPGHNNLMQSNQFIKSLYPEREIPSETPLRLLGDEQKINPFLLAESLEEFLQLKKQLNDFNS